MEKEFLNSKNIKYENVVVDENPAAVDELVKVSGHMGVPVTVITKEDGKTETVIGFDQAKLQSILNIS